MKLAGRVVIVTGASRGIGRATAQLLASHGAILVCTGRDEDELRTVSALVGGSYLVADLTEAGAAERVTSRSCSAAGNSATPFRERSASAGWQLAACLASGQFALAPYREWAVRPGIAG